MIEQIKKIKLDDLQNELKDVLEKRKDEERKKTELESELVKLEYDSKNPVVYVPKFNFFERLFTRRKEYIEYQKKLNERENIPQRIESVKRQLCEEAQRLSESDIYIKYDDIKRQLLEVTNARTLKDLRMSTLSAIKFLEERDIEPVLSKDDKVETDNPRDYFTLNSLIGVHKTQIPPIDSQIKTSKSANVTRKENIVIDGQKYSYEYCLERDTVHMSINDEVSSHTYGNWDDCKYAILIPITEIPQEKIVNAAPMDTFTKGNIKLTQSCWILCPANEVQQIKQNNPGVKVLGYEGENVLGYPQPFLSSLGYRAENAGMWSWSDEQSNEEYHNLMEMYKIKTCAHSNTYFSEDEITLTKINQLVAFCKLLKTNSALIKNSKDDVIQSEISSVLVNLLSKSNYTREPEGGYGGYDPNAIKANHKHLDIFFEKMDQAGFVIPLAYKTIIRNIESIGDISMISKYNPEMIDRAFNINNDATDEERKVIEDIRKEIENDNSYGNKKDIILKSLSNIISDIAFKSKNQEKLVGKDIDDSDDAR